MISVSSPLLFFVLGNLLNTGHDFVVVDFFNVSFTAITINISCMRNITHESCVVFTFIV